MTEFRLSRAKLGSAKDRNRHLLERLGLARLARCLARMVRARVYRFDHGVRLAHRRQRRVAPRPLVGPGVRPARSDHVRVVARVGVLRPRDTDVQELWRDWTQGARRATLGGRADRVGSGGRVDEGGRGGKGRCARGC